MLTLVFHDGYLKRYPTGAVETPARARAVFSKLKEFYPVVTPEPASKADILRAHDPEQLVRVQLEGLDVLAAAFLAAGGALCAAQLALSGRCAFAAIRPPGHHAGRNRYGGFCFFNNMAVAVLSLLEKGLAKSAAVVDIDMHRADGTAEILGDDSRVHLVDMTLADGADLMDRLESRLEELGPVDVIGVSAGFDLHVQDWGNLLTNGDYHRIGRVLGETARRKARGRLFALLEGGYTAHALGKAALAFCRGLEGKEGWETVAERRA
ncbi:Acetoin utilization deacetylase AcuC [Desulfacinum hydrothermale DSM 13146]|uniref:Acetoin utilization deacetylase AcuC n=1 Tax=Desulfacinum hydrothermale DSM 13146 TaxID=1121390 RepID=A0A1W1XLD9_9BACT|nr:histone deacetylase family protein [Desulfacinum hydrothermale]SMC24637.1 Acetoin utilization deacetylase AcuC [Desulfacinum hydrothermale DSM 13146]